MKKLIFTCAMLTGISVISFAQLGKLASSKMAGALAPADQKLSQLADQKNKMSDQMAVQQTKEMQKKFGLSDDQYTKALDVNKTYGAKMMAMKDPANRKLTDADKQAINDERDTKLKAIFNSDQYAKYDAARAMFSPQAAAAPTPATK